MKYLFQEVSLNKKKEKILNIYENIIKENNYRSREILFLVPNSITKLNYMRDIKLPFSEELKITTYSHFVQSELKKYWPILEQNCSQIKKNKIRPSFISIDTSTLYRPWNFATISSFIILFSVERRKLSPLK